MTVEPVTVVMPDQGFDLTVAELLPPGPSHAVPASVPEKGGGMGRDIVASVRQLPDRSHLSPGALAPKRQHVDRSPGARATH
jgi:hypothetical protein